MNDEETQEIIQARNQGKKKDFRIQETDGMLMQESIMYVPNNAELKKEILDEAHISAYAMHPRVREKYSLSLLAKLFISKIVEYHGVPVNIISDRDPRFTSKFWVAFQEALGVGERVLVGPEIVDETTQNVQLSPWKGVIRFGKKGKLSPRYIGPYMITERVDPSQVIPPQPLEINPDLTYDEEPVTILDWKNKELRNKTIHLVKVLWRNHSVEEAT
ncbi:unnamed protein product [Malus baccata var. baccata]